MSAYAFQHTPTYDDCIRRLSRSNPAALTKLATQMPEFTRSPLQKAVFNTHAFRGMPGSEKVFISYIGGSKGYRLIWRLVNRTVVLLLFGEHDVEERAKRLQITEDVETGGVKLVEYERAQSQTPEPGPASTVLMGSLFIPWTDAELERYGFSQDDIARLRALNHLEELEACEPTMGSVAYDRALTLALYHDLDASNRKSQVAEQRRAEVQRQVIAPGERALERKMASPKSRKHFAPISADTLASLLAEPIEDWMIFLHPDQARLTQRPFSGPARVRGAAGTGKTVVALHRARHLAETYRGKVLFTTYVTNLPKVYEGLFRRLSPEHSALVEFVNLHAWAHRFVRSHGSSFQVDSQRAFQAYNEAFRKVSKRQPNLERLGWHYLREELDWVIKGRGISSKQRYLDLVRTGRGTALPQTAREQVWDLYEEYERQLDRRSIIDFNDVLGRALELLRSGRGSSPYRAVVIDEAQDLTEIGLRLAYELAGAGERDGLFLVGDGQQSVYPGGFSLSQLGIDVRGRSALLRINYRNTRAILAAAGKVVGHRPFDDGDVDLEERDASAVTVVREGSPPSLCGFASIDDHDVELVAAIQAVIGRDDVGPGDVAVLVPTNRMVSDYAGRIQGLGLRTQKLQEYDGSPNDRVKVGTFQRGKGLEFKHVFLPRLDVDGLQEQRRSGEDDAMHTERLDLMRRQVFVAMTRARDGLWCGWVGSPGSVLADVMGADEASRRSPRDAQGQEDARDPDG